MLAFLALLGAPYIYIYDISSLRVKVYMAVNVKITMFLGVTLYRLAELYCYSGRKLVNFHQNI